MKVFIAKYEPDRQGGGWTFARHLAKGLEDLFTTNYEEATIYFIPSPSMVQRDEVIKAKVDGKKVVLRIDNAVRNSRNRNTGMSRMYDMAQIADLVVYQSFWALEYLLPFLGVDGAVILNGTDLPIFTDKRNNDVVLYSRFNRDETKGYEIARYWYSQYQLESPEAKLLIVGQFSDELRAGNFDFYNNERFDYLGTLDAHNMGKMYRHAGKFLYTYFNDACSNTLIEALVSGCELVGPSYYLSTGGAPEIIDKFEHYGPQYFSVDRMISEYLAVMEAL